MISSYVGENKEFERQYLSGELEVELTPQVSWVPYYLHFIMAEFSFHRITDMCYWIANKTL